MYALFILYSACITSSTLATTCSTRRGPNCFAAPKTTLKKPLHKVFVIDAYETFQCVNGWENINEYKLKLQQLLHLLLLLMVVFGMSDHKYFHTNKYIQKNLVLCLTKFIWQT